MKELINEWVAAKVELDRAKKEEMRLRNLLVSACPGDIGTSHTVTDGFKVTIVRTITRTVDAAELDLIWHQLSEMEKGCIKYTPSLDTKMFKGLPATSPLTRAVIEKPAAPKVTVEPYDD